MEGKNFNDLLDKIQKEFEKYAFVGVGINLSQKVMEKFLNLKKAKGGDATISEEEIKMIFEQTHKTNERFNKPKIKETKQD